MISLYGGLARAFEKKYQLSAKKIPISVKSATEMMRAMESNFQGFRSLLKRSGLYKVTRGQAVTHGNDISPDEVEMNFAQKDWHIMPIAAGCKSGWGKALLGVVLISASFFVPFAGPMLFGLGASMALGGIAQALAPTPSVGDYGDRERPDARPSYLSSGPENRVEPGLTLPVAYGDCWCGSITVSAGVKVEDI